nr:Ig-like domain-containing protein [uncultured Ruminococcus sp.]
MKRKVLSVIMAILMMSVIITPFTANATRTSIEQVGAIKEEGVTSDGWNYCIYDDGTAGVIGYSGTSTTATLPVSIDNHNVKYYVSLLLYSNKYGTSGDKIEKLIIPDSNTPIAVDENITSVFRGSPNLKEVQIGTLFINIIPNNCFDGCKKLSKVTFSDKFLEQAKAFGKTKFGDECFANCSSLKTFVIPEGIKSDNLSRTAFYNSNIENLIIYGDTAIEGNAYDIVTSVHYMKNVVIFKNDVEVKINGGVDENLNCTFYANKNSKMEDYYNRLMDYAKDEEINLNYNFVDISTVNIDSMIEAWQNGEEPTEPTTTSTTVTTATTTSTSTTQPSSSSISTPDEPVTETTTVPTSTTETKPTVVKASGISLNTNKLALTRYGIDVKEKLTATVTPNETTNKKVKWTSSNNKIATVDENGYVTAKGKGIARITATTTDGSNLSATCTVTVKQMVTMIVNTMNINRGSKNVNRKLPVMVGNNATNKTLNYRSGNSKVVSVNAKGQITAKKKGTATVSVKTTDGTNIVVYYRVTVKQLVTSVKLNKKAISLKAKGKAKQKTYTLKATVTKGANNKKVKWTTSNKKVAVVNSKGKVTAKKKGTCYISVTSTDGSRKSAKCKVTVK